MREFIRPAVAALSVVCLAALIAVSSAANDLSDLRGAVEAMACCAKTDYQCAGVNTPDDCCAHMHHAPAQPVPATAARNITERHLRIMDSYIAAPEAHAAAVKNPKLLGGPFMDYDGNRAEEIALQLDRREVPRSFGPHRG